MNIKEAKEIRTDAYFTFLRYERTSNRISTGRLISFLLFVVALIFAIAQNNVWGYVVAGVSFAAFLTLVILHPRVLKKQEYYRSRTIILKQYVRRFSDEWQLSEEDGSRYLKEDYPPARDLDLFGKKSLYQYLCTAHTRQGKDLLAQWLTAPPPEPEEIRSRQQAVRELSQKQDFSFHLQTLGDLFEQESRKSRDEDMEKFLAYAESSEGGLHPVLKLVAWAVPLFTLAAILLAAFQLIPLVTVPICIILQLLLAIPVQHKVQATLRPLFSFQDEVTAYEEIFKELDKNSFNCERLKTLQSRFSERSGARMGIRSLGSVCELAKIRHNPLLYLLGLCLCLWDYQCLNALERWKSRYGGQIRSWLSSVGELEALVSLSVLCQVRENHCFPEILPGDSPRIEARGLSHPLLSEEQAVGNPVSLRAKTCVITGSNMSGKTTYLRTIGVNTLLAYAGAPVCGQSFSVTRMAVFTSMRIEDDVSRGISTFYAEILRIRSMVEYAKKRLPMLVLIDEIFKGTNSADRVIGATQAIRRLSVPWAVTVVSTHDFELCALSEDETIRAVNFHFSETYQKDEIHFDYTLKEGRCQTTNAQHLLRMAGIL